MAAIVRSEIELLLCCACVQMSQDRVSKLETLLTQPIDWERLLNLAEAHKVLPLLHRHLSALRTDAVPAALLMRLKEIAHAIAHRNLLRAGELASVLEIFQEHGISAIPVKGPVLSFTAYGNLGLRAYNDLDIIIPEADAITARDLLIARGYQAVFLPSDTQEAAVLQIAREYKLFDQESGILIELQWKLIEDQFCVPIDQSRIRTALQPVCIAGTAMMSLGPEDLLLFLCVHSGKHQWVRLIWVCDVAQHVLANPGLDWQRVLQEARALHCTGMLLLGVDLASALLSAPIPSAILEQARGDSAVAALSQEIQSRILAGDLRVRGAVESFRFYWRLRDRFRERVLHPIRFATTITVHDLASVRLPRTLFPLYLLARPLRLAVKHGRSLWKKTWRR